MFCRTVGVFSSKPPAIDFEENCGNNHLIDFGGGISFLSDSYKDLQIMPH